jgi:hypothetical protein
MRGLPPVKLSIRRKFIVISPIFSDVKLLDTSAEEVELLLLLGHRTIPNITTIYPVKYRRMWGHRQFHHFPIIRRRWEEDL